MKRKKLYIVILLLAGVLTSCKVGKAMSVLIFICPTAWKEPDSISFGDQDWGIFIRMLL